MNFKSKKLTALLLALVIALSATACGNENTESTAPSEEAPSVSESAAAPSEEAEAGAKFEGEVTEIEKYGNLKLSISGKDLADAGFKAGDVLKITVNGKEFSVPYCTDYSDVDTGEVLLRNKEDSLTLAYNMSDFATNNGFATKKTNEDKTYEWIYNEGVENPLKVTIEMGEAGGYYDLWLIHHLERTNERKDYEALSDEEFANFRNIATQGMGENVLYRTSSPINPELGRNTFADKAMENAGVKSVINLADDKEKASAYEGFGDTYYSKQNVLYLNLGIDFKSDSFKAGTLEAAKFIASPDTEAPYMVHCTEGKDRAGLISALLECFMGASYDEVVNDYMTSYYNYYNVEEGSEQAKLIAASNIEKTLSLYFEVENIKEADLQKEAYEYFLSIGLTEEEAEALRAKLA